MHARRWSWHAWYTYSFMDGHTYTAYSIQICMSIRNITQAYCKSKARQHLFTHNPPCKIFIIQYEWFISDRYSMLLLFSTQCRIAPWRLCGELVYWPDGGELDFFNTAGVKHKLWEFTQTRYIFYRNPATLYLLFFFHVVRYVSRAHAIVYSLYYVWRLKPNSILLACVSMLTLKLAS